MEQQLRVEVLIGADPVKVLLAGDIDLNTEGQVTATLADLAGHDVVVDLSGVGFMDSSGLTSLLIAHRNITAAGGTFALRKPSPTAARVLAVAAVDTALDIID